MCIYYGEKDSLTYNSQEHIFPATVGGICKLPQNYVSDAANQYFSKLESELVTSSLFGFEKMFFGPGSRGKEKPGRMPITLLTTKDNENLGFSFLGKPILIPQFCVNANNKEVHIVRDENYQTQNDLIKLITKIKNFDSNNKYILVSKKLEFNNFIFGFYDNNIFIAIENTNQIQYYVELIKKNILDSIDFSKEMKSDVTQPSVQLSLTVDIDNNSKVFAKTAFNVLANLKGYEYAQDKHFDDFKNSLLGITENKFKQLPIDFKFDITNYVNVDEKSHYCILLNCNQKLCAIVKFYNHWTMTFALSDKFDDYFNYPYIYICDWKNKKENYFLEFLHQYN